MGRPSGHQQIHPAVAADATDANADAAAWPLRAPPPPRRSTGAAWTALRVLLALLMADALVELALISATVDYLNNTLHGGVFTFISGLETIDTGTYGTTITTTTTLPGLPRVLLVDQGHTANGAAGTAFVAIGLGGIAALALRNLGGGGGGASSGSRRKSGGGGGGGGGGEQEVEKGAEAGRSSNSRRRRTAAAKFGRALYYVWAGLQVPALLLTAAALGYVFAVTPPVPSQSVKIELSIAESLGSDGRQPYPGTWTPQGWLDALGALDLVNGESASGGADVRAHARIARGWQWNLVPLLLLQIAQTALAGWDFWAWRRAARAGGGYRYGAPGEGEGEGEGRDAEYGYGGANGVAGDGTGAPPSWDGAERHGYGRSNLG
ncbi:hypothetical protein GGR56DRAFT_414517 [Xylariaceae sp. FL0804]|nr:hypothetical protein GGR56DRAFT_414517 [Xylariaceae sp. FL0804]